MKPIEFVITRKGISAKAKFARWYFYTLFDSNRYTVDLAMKWNNIHEFLNPNVKIDHYGIGIKDRPDDADPDNGNKRYFPPLDLLPTDATYLIMWGDRITCNSWTKDIKNSGDIVAVLENLRLEYDLQEEKDEGN
jgi:hypothetical protein